MHSDSGRHQDTSSSPEPTVDQTVDTVIDTAIDTTVEPVEPADQTTGPVQLELSTPDGHVRFHLDRRTREIGLANIAAIKRQLAVNAARRAEQQARSATGAGGPSGRAA